MLVAEGLCKVYKNPVVVNLDLHVHPGEIYGFLGPNGAGKSTTIHMILGLIRPTRGRVRIFGRELAEDYFGIKRRIGVVAETQRFYEEMTGQEYLLFFADLYGVGDKKRRVRELLERLDLAAARGLQLRKYSKGMAQKLALVKALLPDPDLLILDEPVSSLDPYGIKQVRDLILAENGRGKTFLVSSHLLSEVERTCHRVGIINRGVLVAEDTMDGLRKRLGGGALEIELESVPSGLLSSVRSLPFVATASLAGRLMTIRTRDHTDRRSEIARFLNEVGCIALTLKKNQMSLEEAFVTITEGNLSMLTGDRCNDGNAS